jgi:4-hydroxyphenylpyruvate dioxygenase
VDQHSAALAGMSYFGLVQYIGDVRSADWMAYYENLFGFTQIQDEQRFGILPKGKLMRIPCGAFLWQLVEPDPAWMTTARPSACSVLVWERSMSMRLSRH